MPTTSTSAPLTKMATVNAQNAGLQMRPICCADNWNAALIAGSISPRIAKTIDVVTSEMQLATNSRDVFMCESSRDGVARLQLLRVVPVWTGPIMGSQTKGVNYGATATPPKLTIAAIPGGVVVRQPVATATQARLFADASTASVT